LTDAVEREPKKEHDKGSCKSSGQKFVTCAYRVGQRGLERQRALLLTLPTGKQQVLFRVGDTQRSISKGPW